MSERIERWANVYSDGSLSTFWVSQPPTLPHARIAHFVEIRDGESITVNDALVREWAPMAPWPLVEEARRERDTAERERDTTIVKLKNADEACAKLQWRLEKAEAERDKWQETARLEVVNRDFYRGKLDKADARVDSLKVENATLREFLKRFEDGGMSGAEVRAAQDDAAAKFERWAAVRFFGKPWQNSATNEVHYFGRDEAIDEARRYRSHYFPAKEA